MSQLLPGAALLTRTIPAVKITQRTPRLDRGNSRLLIGTLAWLGTAALVIGGPTTSAVAATIPTDGTSVADAAATQAFRSEATTIAGQYVVVLKDQAGLRTAGVHTTSTAATVKAAAERGRKAGAQIRRQFTGAIQGYSATLSAAELAAVRRDPAVASVEPNHVYRLPVTAASNPVTTSTVGTASTTQKAPDSWGLDRVDQKKLPLDKKYYLTATGKGVTAFVVDTGFAKNQTDLDHVKAGRNVVDGSSDTTDCLGHGTHVGGTIGGTEYGVAKEVTLVPIRVFGCADGASTETVVAGLDAVLDYPATGPRVVNMSLGGDVDSVIDAGVQKLIDAGVSVVVAAGNGNAAGNGVSACLSSPARVPAAITVGATTIKDKRSTFSNFGKCVDLYAPGEDIKSDWLNKSGKPQTNVISGTSMATPHVTGTVAMYLQRNPTATPAQVQAAIIGTATKDKVTNVASTWPRLLLLAVQRAVVPASVTKGNKLLANQSLSHGNKICSSNAVYCLDFSSTGALQLRKVTSPTKTVWSASKSASWVKLADTGLLSAYDSYGRSIWTSAKTGGKATLYVNSSGYLAILRDSDAKLLWSSRS